MVNYISPWDVFHRSEVEASRAAFETRPDFAKLVEEAERLGYRRITLTEQLDAGVADAFTWQGGVWVKKDT